MFGYAMTAALGTTSDNMLNTSMLETTVPFKYVVGAIMYMWLRYSTGQVVLDNDICRPRHKAKALKDSRDSDLTHIDLDIKRVLLQCPAYMVTFPCIAWFCSPAFDSLKSKKLFGIYTGLHKDRQHL